LLSTSSATKVIKALFHNRHSGQSFFLIFSEIYFTAKGASHGQLGQFGESDIICKITYALSFIPYRVAVNAEAGCI
jgi:hypothetical protein